MKQRTRRYSQAIRSNSGEHPDVRRPLALLLLLFALATAASAQLEPAQQAAQPATIDPAATAWLLVSAALVLFMVTGLALFYGGLVRRKNVLNTMMMSFICLGIVALTWVSFGYSLAYDEGNRLLGGGGNFFLRGIGTGGDGIPALLDVAFQGGFAIVAAALVSGAVVERMRFSAYMIFIAVWSMLVYAPLAHWAWGGGIFDDLLGRSAIDFAGGTVVHVNAAVSALVLALLVGRRRDFGRKALLPHQIPLSLIGAGILWFGWFGFNGGSAYASDATAALAFLNTLLAPAATVVGWALLDIARTGRVTAVGLATAVVVGLVAITPGAGVMSPMAAVLTGAVAAVPCYLAIGWRARSGLDDSLDVFAAHGVGGITGALLTGLLASTAWGASADGGFAQLLTQAAAVVISILFSAAGTLIIAGAVSLIVPLRAPEEQEATGLDVPLHGEEGYTDGEGALLIPVLASPKAARIANAAGRPLEGGA